MAIINQSPEYQAARARYFFGPPAEWPRLWQAISRLQAICPVSQAVARLELAKHIFGDPAHWDDLNELLEWTWCLYDEMQSGHLRVRARSEGAEYTLKHFRAWAQAWMDNWEQTPWDKNSEEPE